MDAPTVDLSVVLPAYHEEENLRLLLPRLQSVLAASGLTHEILVVDTPAPLDHTEQLCAERGVRHVRREGGWSFGAAVRTGIARAAGRLTLFMDADGSHAPEFIPKLLARRDEADVIVASRYVPGGFTENPWLLIVMSRVLNLTYSLVLGLPCRDVSNSFKLYRTDALQALRLRCDNFDVIEEILFKLRWKNPALSILEIPFTFKQRMFGKTKRNLVLFVFTYVFTMVKLRLSVRGEE